MLIDVIPEHWFRPGYEATVIELLRDIGGSAAERESVLREWGDRSGVTVTREHLEALGVLVPAVGV